jgi:hypothetical protein
MLGTWLDEGEDSRDFEVANLAKGQLGGFGPVKNISGL